MARRRVIHIVENLNRGAVENWLIRMLGRARGCGIEVDWTFYCAVGLPGELDDRARALGAAVVLSPVPIGSKTAFMRALRLELQRGRYDVLHCHHDLVSSLYLLAACGISMGRRIVHVHNADEVVPTPSHLKQRLFREPMRRICLSMADRIIGVSEHALDTFLGGRSRRPDCDVVRYCGLDATPFQNLAADRVGFRHRWNLPAESRILFFGGRLVPEKNPLFVVSVLACLRRTDSRAVAVFAGAGSLDQQILARAKALNVEDSVRLIGWRNDLPEVMSCCDWFILPHLEDAKEGFGLAVLEAQLAGLRMLLSEGIPDDPLLPSATYFRLPLSRGPDEWAKAALELLKREPLSSIDAIAALKQSGMEIDRALVALLNDHA